MICCWDDLGNKVLMFHQVEVDKYSVTKRLERQCLYGNSFLLEDDVYKVIMYWQVEQQLQLHWGLGDDEMLMQWACNGKTATTSHLWRVTAYDTRAPQSYFQKQNWQFTLW